MQQRIRGETYRRSLLTDNGVDDRRDLGTSNMEPIVLVMHDCERSRAGGTVALKICDTEMQCRYRKALGVARSAVDDGISHNTFLCVVKRRLP